MLVNHTKRRAVRCVLRVVCFAKCSFLAKNSENHVFQQQNHEIFNNKKHWIFFEKSSKVLPPKFDFVSRKSISLARHRTDLAPSCPKTCLFASSDQEMLSKRAENIVFAKMLHLGNRIGKMLHLGHRSFRRPEIPKLCDFVYTNPSQASHLDVKKKT